MKPERQTDCGRLARRRERTPRSRAREGLRPGPFPGARVSLTQARPLEANRPRHLSALCAFRTLSTARFASFSALEKTAQFRSRDSRRILGNGVSVKRILGVVVHAVHCSCAFLFLQQGFYCSGAWGRGPGTGKRPVHPSSPGLGLAALQVPGPVRRRPGVECDRWTWVPVNYNVQLLL